LVHSQHDSIPRLKEKKAARQQENARAEQNGAAYPFAIDE